MSWAARRRFLVLLILGLIVAAFLTVVVISTVYKTPTCSDSVQNQNEAGIDCGGPCAYLCVADEQPPTVLFTKALTNAAGRVDIVASVENKNVSAAARNVPYQVMLYGPNQTLIQTFSGTVDLPPGARQTIFLPGVLTGNQTVVNAFFEIASTSPAWFALAFDPRIVPSVSDTTQSGSTDAPRVEAILANRSVRVLTNVRVIVLVRDVRKEVIAASQTIVPLIPAQNTAHATFTWNNAFPGIPASIEVVPVIPLP